MSPATSGFDWMDGIPIYNPEPTERAPVSDEAPIGVPLAYDGAVITMLPNGDYICEHGRNITGSPTSTARGCVIHCKGEKP